MIVSVPGVGISLSIPIHLSSLRSTSKTYLCYVPAWLSLNRITRITCIIAMLCSTVFCLGF